MGNFSLLVSNVISAIYCRGYMCIKAESGALVFGVISAVITCLICLIDLTIMVAFNISDWNDEEINFHHRLMFISPGVILKANIVMCSVAFKFLIDFLFAVLLCDGICKKKPGFILAYFIYGIVMAILSGLFILFVFITGAMETALILLSLWFGYCMILGMVKVAHGKMSTGVIYQYQHKILDETAY